LSSETDHARATFEANAGTEKLVSVCLIVLVFNLLTLHCATEMHLACKNTALAVSKAAINETL